RDAGPAASAAAPARAASSAAVLPFEDRSASADQQFLGDGIGEEVTATLARVEGLRVAARSAAFALRGHADDVREVGRRLGVTAVVEGSVQRDGERLRVTASLVNVADGFQLWSARFDRAAGDVFALQEEIARAVAQALRVRLVEGARRAAPDARAYELYLQGRYAWYRRTEEGLRTAARYFEQAAALAPGYPQAHAGLADAYAVLGFYDYLPPADAFPRAEAAARRAIALDSSLAAPHATLGYAALYHRWDVAAGEAAFRRAVALDPDNSTAHQWYGNLLTAAGRFDEAERELRHAVALDPLSLIARSALGWSLVHAGAYAAALAECRRALELDPRYAVALLWGGWALEGLDSLPAAVAWQRRAVAASDSGALYVAELARALARAGGRAEAAGLPARLPARADSGRYLPAYEIAKALDALGERAAAFRWLERAYRERSHSLVFLRVDPQLAGPRRDPRFAALAARGA
ncbi:tetratricopeptide repeat protein, partial [Roseisolibacter sp. H3M3-2]|uniref:tetratricopeptide repeat protein n=1 Tax=Roseisolibacter sp. H3M3-2 TaxID=3031323 RepID=UPI0023DB1DA5